MGSRPDLGDMAITKAKAGATVPFNAAPALPSEPAANTGPKSLTIKLDGPTYAELRSYCHQKEVTLGRRFTHQEVMVMALKALLAGEAAK